MDDLHTGAVDSGRRSSQRLVAALDGKERRMERWQIERALMRTASGIRIPGQARMQFLQEPQPALLRTIAHRPDNASTCGMLTGEAWVEAVAAAVSWSSLGLRK
ncbi:hypothetical protein CFE70_010664, partial [Pyrenophora teres f. teres 0-1]